MHATRLSEAWLTKSSDPLKGYLGSRRFMNTRVVIPFWLNLNGAPTQSCTETNSRSKRV